MQIGILTSSYPRYAGDGAGTFVRSLAEAYAREGHTVCAIAPHDALAQPVAGAVHVRRFRYAPNRLSLMGHARSLRADRHLQGFVPLLVPTFYLAALRALDQAHRQQAFDWVHAQWLVPSGAIAATFGRLRHIPFVLTLQGSDIYLAERNRVLSWWARRTLRASHLTVGVSDDLSQRARALGLPHERSATIPNGVDPEMFKPDAGAARRVRDRLNLSPEALLLLAVGRLVHKKGYDVLLRAMPSVLREYPQARLLIAGDGDLRQTLAQLAVDLGVASSVRFLGHVAWTALPEWMNAAELCVFPYVRDVAGNVDGMPTAVVEAMACAKPVVASRLTGMAQLIQHQQSGWLINPGDAPELANAITTLLHDGAQRAQLGANARRRVECEFSWRTIARRYLDFAQAQGWGRD